MRYQKPRWLASYPIRMNRTRTRRFGAISVNGDPAWEMSGKSDARVCFVDAFRCRFFFGDVFFFILHQMGLLGCDTLCWFGMVRMWNCRVGVVCCEIWRGFWGLWYWYLQRNCYWKIVSVNFKFFINPYISCHLFYTLVFVTTLPISFNLFPKWLFFLSYFYIKSFSLTF